MKWIRKFNMCELLYMEYGNDAFCEDIHNTEGWTCSSMLSFLQKRGRLEHLDEEIQ